MANLAERYIDLVASGDEAKINCVLNAGAAGAVTGGVGAAVALGPGNAVPGIGQGAFAIGVGISAAVGLLIGINAGMKVCGQGTDSSLERIFTGQVSSTELSSWKKALQDRGLNGQQTDALISASIVELQTNGLRNIDRDAPLNAVALTSAGDQFHWALSA